jgi:hypothetical protein
VVNQLSEFCARICLQLQRKAFSSDQDRARSISISICLQSQHLYDTSICLQMQHLSTTTMT